MPVPGLGTSLPRIMPLISYSHLIATPTTVARAAKPLRCGYCGEAMTGHTLSKINAAGARVSYRYYRCAKARRGAGECDHNTRYPAIPFEDEVMQAIEKKATNIKNIKKLRKNYVIKSKPPIIIWMIKK